MKYIIALDQGTTSSRALLINEVGKLIDVKQKEFKQIFPKQGWVEHDPIEILNTQLEVFEELTGTISLSDIISIGITIKEKLLLSGIKKLVNLYIMLLYGKIKGLQGYVIK